MKSRKAQKGNQEKKEKEVTKSLAHDADKKKHDFEGHHDIKQNHPLKDWAVKLTIVFASVLLIMNTSNERVDAKKAYGVSFASQYISGDLRQVKDITQILVAAFASVFFDFFVISYHLTYPAHPKFVMVLPRKISIYVHLISGITEISSGIAAFFVASQGLQQFFATIVSLASISHSITAYYQSSIVFGAKGVMTPAYLYCITLHLACAFNLLTNPTSLVNLVSTFLMLHIYVWCRFFVYFFRKFKAFSGYHYTVAITLSGALLLPYVSGPIANFTLLFIVALYCILEAIVSGKTGPDLSRKLFSEHERYALVRSDSVNAWKEHLSDTGATNDEKLAREVFDRYDSNHTGILSVTELNELLSSLNNGLLTEKVLAMADVNGDGQISFGEFYRFIWNYGSMKDRIVKIPKTQAGANKKLSEKELAKLVFNMLDTDGSGYIDLAELEMLLTQWGMPENEADTYLAKYASVKDRNISFDVFYTQMKPIWAFGASEVFEA